MTRTTFAAIGAALTITTAASAATPTIAEIAPPNAIFVIGVDNFAEMHEAFDASFLGDLWRDQEMQAFIEELIEESGLLESVREDAGPVAFLEDTLDRADLDREDLSPPTGPAGISVWFDPDLAGIASNRTDPHMLAMLDFGEDESGDNMRRFMEAALETAEDDPNAIDIVVDEYEGAEIWRFQMNYDELEAMRDEGELIEIDGFEIVREPARPFFVSLVGNSLVLTYKREDMEQTIDRIQGVKMDSLAGTNRFAEATGAHEAGHAYAAIFVRPLLDLLLPTADELGFDPTPVIEALGLHDLESISASVSFDAPGGAIVQSYSVIAHEKNGILSLFDTSLDGFNPPSFVTADANSVFMMAFDWSGLLPLVNQIIAANPDEAVRAQAQAGFGMMAGIAGPMLDAMRQENLMTTRFERPFTLESNKMFGSVGIRDADAITAGINSAGGFFGLVPRDFLGNQIWDIEQIVAIGLAGGNLIIGPTESVEDAMRITGGDQENSLARSEHFREATADLKGGAMLYSYQNTRESYEYAVWTLNNLEKILRDELQQYDLDDATIDEIIEEQLGENPFTTIGFPSADTIFRHMSETVVLEMHSTEDGFRGRTIIRAADDRD